MSTALQNDERYGGSVLERMFNRFGFPTALSLALLMFVGYTLNTFYSDFLKPQADAHLHLVQRLETNLAEQQETNRSIQQSMQEMMRIQQQMLLRMEFSGQKPAFSKEGG